MKGSIVARSTQRSALPAVKRISVRQWWIAVLAFAVVLIAILPAFADSARSLFNKGRDAEAREQYQQAYEYFKQAHEKQPKDVLYKASYERTKFKASAELVHKGQQLRSEGKLTEALALFEQATKIDPSMFIAQQEVTRTREMIDLQNHPEQQPKPPTISEKLVQAGSPVELSPISNQPITLRMTEDSRVVYETIGKLAGVNVLFDPDYTPRRVHIELNGVSLSEALEITSLQSKTFWRPVTSNTIYVAADTKAKRQEVEQQVLRTFYLSNLSTATEIQDITNALRTILEFQRIQMLPSQNAIVVRGTADQVALAEKLITDFDKARPEVVVEVAVMQVSRDKLRQLGIQYPFSSSASPTISLQNNSGTTTTTNNNTTTTPSTTTTNGGITLNDLANVDARNFVVTIPSASVAFLMNDSNTKVIQNPQIRALDGQKGTLKIGERVPVATGSFSGAGGVAGLGVSPLVNTQFQYIDVGVNIDVTPHVFLNRDVDLKVMLEISSVARTATIGGIDQPVIGQRKIEHEIRLKEGEVNLLGGMLEDSESKSMTGLPWLSQIPILKYLFGRSQTERINNEIVFALIPHVVRSTELSDFNMKTIDVGTVNAIELRRDTPPPSRVPQQPAPASQQQQAPAQQQYVPQQPVAPQQPPQTQQQVAPGQPSTAPQGASLSPDASGRQQAQTAPGQAQQVTPPASPILSFDPATISVPMNSTFAVTVQLLGGNNVFSVPAQISYNSKLMQLVNVSNGGSLSPDSQAVALVHREDEQAGTIQMTATRPPGAPGIAVNGPVFVLTFLAKAPGQATLEVNRAMLRDAANNATPAGGSQAVITIR